MPRLRTAAVILSGLVGCLAAAEPSPAPATSSPWGFASSAEWFGEYPRFNPLMAQAGVRHLRAFPEWQTIQPRPGEWNWKSADDLVANAKANNLRIDGCLCFFASWATTDGSTRTAPLKDIATWAAYAAAAAARYRADIRDWEVYNEFNGSFANSKNKPKDYADLVVAAYDAVKRVDPGIRVGMSCANFDLGFFDAAIKAGAAGKFDYIAVHPYENLGTLAAGGEDGYLSMAGSIRKMLADNAQRADIGLWITEFGIQSTVQPDAAQDALQAEILVKGHVLALAQGFERIDWFEARGPAYGHGTDHGVIRQDWSLRPSYHAWKAMTGMLGEAPRYRGWLDLASGGYGFVFQGAAGPVLAAWSSKGVDRTLTLADDATITDLAGKPSKLPAGKPLTLGRVPVYIAPVPASLLQLAQANAGKPFPWGGDYAARREVGCILGATNTEAGIVQVNPQTTEVVNGLDNSYRVGHRKNGEGIYAYFRVDPRFATFGSTDLEVVVVARRGDNAKDVGFDLCYESTSGYKGTGRQRAVPAGADWKEYVFALHDANFVGGWGWNFRTDVGGSAGTLAIKEVRVRKPAGPPAK